MRITNKELILVIILELLIFQYPLDKYCAIFGYVDEIFALFTFILGVFLFIARRKKVQRPFSIILLGILIFNIMGWISSYVYGYRTLKINILSSFLSNKFFLAFIGVLCIFEVYPSIRLLLFRRNIMKVLRVTVLMVVAWHLVSLYMSVFAEFGSNEICAKLVFLVAYCFATWQGKKDYKYVLIALIGFATSDAMKGYGAIVLILLIGYWSVRKKKEFKISEIVVSGIIVIAFAWSEFNYYIVEGIKNGAPRAMMLKYGADVATARFPFGTGWGTFGSHYAAQLYSPVYIELGWENHYSVGRKCWFYLNDVFWPNIYTEAGWIGFIGFMIFLIEVFILIQKQYDINKRIYAAGILSFAYMMVTTLESTSFCHPATLIVAIMFVTAASNPKSEEEIKLCTVKKCFWNNQINYRGESVEKRFNINSGSGIQC